MTLASTNRSLSRGLGEVFVGQITGLYHGQPCCARTRGEKVLLRTDFVRVNSREQNLGSSQEISIASR